MRTLALIPKVMLCAGTDVLFVDHAGQLAWTGGEAAGLERLYEYVARGLKSYTRTRNQLSGKMQVPPTRMSVHLLHTSY